MLLLACLCLPTEPCVNMLLRRNGALLLLLYLGDRYILGHSLL